MGFTRLPFGKGKARIARPGAPVHSLGSLRPHGTGASPTQPNTAAPRTLASAGEPDGENLTRTRTEISVAMLEMLRSCHALTMTEYENRLKNIRMGSGIPTGCGIWQYLADILRNATPVELQHRALHFRQIPLWNYTQIPRNIRSGGLPGEYVSLLEKFSVYVVASHPVGSGSYGGYVTVAGETPQSHLIALELARKMRLGLTHGFTVVYDLQTLSRKEGA